MSQNPVIDRAKLHFSSTEVLMIEVPEWGEDDRPLVIYCRPFNMDQKNRLFKKSAAKDGVVNMAFMVECLIMKSEDSEGNKMFTLEDRKDLMLGVDPDIIVRVSTEMLKGVDMDVEEMSGN